VSKKERRRKRNKKGLPVLQIATIQQGITYFPSLIAFISFPLAVSHFSPSNLNSG
jgi:hypothetical protein